jgi:beta-1,4-mannooligosaccharide/beta-1,4-mannosyl-N-acetylglucosamine phosphorylase
MHCPIFPGKKDRGKSGNYLALQANPVIGGILLHPPPGYNSAVCLTGEFVGVFGPTIRTAAPIFIWPEQKDGESFQIDDNVIPGRKRTETLSGQLCLIRAFARSMTGIMWSGDDMHGFHLRGLEHEFKTWIRLPNPLMPFNRNGVLFPRKINGTYRLLSRPSDSGHTPFGDIFISESPDLIYWGRHKHVMGKGGKGWWQGTKIGAGPTPIETTEGWLLFYHGVSYTCNGFVYSYGAVLLDLEEPEKVLYRCGDYLLTPEKEYETAGFVPNVVFPCQNLYDAPTGRIAIYYGAADTYTALAFCRVEEVVDYIKKHNEVF